MKILFIIITIFSSGLAAHDHQGLKSNTNFDINNNVIILSSDNYEKCFHLHKGQVLSYAFSSSGELEFNIHYHYKNKLFFPIFPEIATNSKGTLSAYDEQEYCAMWSNNSNFPITIKYQLKSAFAESQGDET